MLAGVESLKKRWHPRQAIFITTVCCSSFLPFLDHIMTFINNWLQAAWLLKIRALVEESYTDEADLEEEGMADILMDENATAQIPSVEMREAWKDRWWVLQNFKLERRKKLPSLTHAHAHTKMNTFNFHPCMSNIHHIILTRTRNIIQASTDKSGDQPGRKVGRGSIAKSLGGKKQSVEQMVH